MKYTGGWDAKTLVTYHLQFQRLSFCDVKRIYATIKYVSPWRIAYSPEKCKAILYYKWFMIHSSKTWFVFVYLITKNVNVNLMSIETACLKPRYSIIFSIVESIIFLIWKNICSSTTKWQKEITTYWFWNKMYFHS